MIDNKPRSKVILDELRGEGNVSLVPMTQVSLSRVASTQDRGEPYRSGSTRAFHWYGRSPRRS